MVCATPTKYHFLTKHYHHQSVSCLSLHLSGKNIPTLSVANAEGDKRNMFKFIVNKKELHMY